MRSRCQDSPGDWVLGSIEDCETAGLDDASIALEPSDMLDHSIDLDEPGVCECVCGRQGVRAIHLPQQVGDGPDWCRHVHAIDVLDVVTVDDGLPGTAAVVSYAADSVPSHHRGLEVVPATWREDVQSAQPCSSFVADNGVLRGDELDGAQATAARVGHPSVDIDIAKLTTYEAELDVGAKGLRRKTKIPSHL